MEEPRISISTLASNNSYYKLNHKSKSELMKAMKSYIHEKRDENMRILISDYQLMISSTF